MAKQIKSAVSALHNILANDDAVVDFKTFDSLNDTSPATRKRLLKAGKGPPVVQLSERRRGIIVRDYKLWRASRTVGPASFANG
jgi:hypothetical protein